MGERPLPAASPDYVPLRESARDGELRLQRCGGCGRFRYPVSPVCFACFSPAYGWEPVAGTGRVASWVVFHRAYFAGFDAPPYTVVQAELDEGPRLTANLRPDEPDRLAVGARVRLVYERVADGVVLPQWQLEP